MYHCILQRDVFEFDLVFEKEPVRDVYVYRSRIKKSVFVPVQYQRSFEEHTIEKSEVYMLDPHCCVEVVRNCFSGLVNEKILNESCLYQQPY